MNDLNWLTFANGVTIRNEKKLSQTQRGAALSPMIANGVDELHIGEVVNRAYLEPKPNTGGQSETGAETI